MRDRRRRENSKHEPRAAVIPLVSLIYLYISLPLSLALQSSSEYFVSIPLMVIGCPFFVGLRVVGI